MLFTLAASLVQVQLSMQTVSHIQKIFFLFLTLINIHTSSAPSPKEPMDHIKITFGHYWHFSYFQVSLGLSVTVFSIIVLSKFGTFRVLHHRLFPHTLCIANFAIPSKS